MINEPDRTSSLLSGAGRVSHPGEGLLLGSVARFTVKEGAKAVCWLIDYLKARNIEASPGSPLERAALRTLEVAERHRAGSAVPAQQTDAELLETYSELAGLAEFAYALYAVRKHKDANRLLPLLELLAKPSGQMPGPKVSEVASLAQPMQSAADGGANQLFALLMACFALRGGHDLEIDDGEKDGTNPDILVTLENARWGFACKALHSNNPQSLSDLVEDGARQLFRSKAERGTVLLSMRSRLVAMELLRPQGASADHAAELVVPRQPWPDSETLRAAVESQCQSYFGNAEKKFGREPLLELLRGTRPMRGMAGVGYFAHALGIVADSCRGVLLPRSGPHFPFWASPAHAHSESAGAFRWKSFFAGAV